MKYLLNEISSQACHKATAIEYSCICVFKCISRNTTRRVISFFSRSVACTVQHVELQIQPYFTATRQFRTTLNLSKYNLKDHYPTMNLAGTLTPNIQSTSFMNFPTRQKFHPHPSVWRSG